MMRPTPTSRRLAVAGLAVALGAGVGLGAIILWNADGAGTQQGYRLNSAGIPSPRSGASEGPTTRTTPPTGGPAADASAADAAADGLTMDEATAIAIQFAPGRVVEVDQDRDFLSGLQYDVTVLHDNGTSTQIEVDADTGQIVSTDFDNDWD
jgi:hypothetical protein